MLMINLVNTSLYSFNKTYDYQSVCDPEKDGKAAAGPRTVFVVRYLQAGSHQFFSENYCKHGHCIKHFQFIIFIIY